MKVRHLKRLKSRPRGWTVTGRYVFGLQVPKLQNIPLGTVFKPHHYQKSLLMQLDFSDIEARIIAMNPHLIKEIDQCQPSSPPTSTP